MTSPYGTCRDVPDHRDYLWDAPRGILARLPGTVDLRRRCPPVYNQGPLNSCSANALAAAMWYEGLKNGGASSAGPSRLFIYYNERSRARQPRCNVPVSLRDGHKVVAKLGACLERHWQYRFGNFSVRPPKHCYDNALSTRVGRYERVKRDLRALKARLAGGFPFTMGMSVYESFESPSVKATGIVPMPKLDEALKGGHAVMVVGYTDRRESFIVRNSWGATWGRGGYFLLPYEYLLSDHRYAWDFWTIVELSTS